MRRFGGLILILLGLVACGKVPVHQQESFVFGTRVEILVAGLDERAARQASDRVLREFDRLHRTYHAWLPSELSALNTAMASGKTAEVTPEMASILSDAQRLTTLGKGLFDPGIGHLIQLWGFQSDEFKAVLPPPTALAEWRKSPPSLKDLQIQNQQIRSRHRGVAIDLGGYLKGYALDRAAAILHDQGVRNALINIGGNVMALGTKNGSPWRIGIQHPRQPGPLAVLSLKDGEAIGTSGDYQRYFELDGKRYCHLLDPSSGLPVTHTQSLSVLITPQAGAGTLSDAASKPLFIAGKNWPELAPALGVSHVLRVDADGHLEASAAFMQRIESGSLTASDVSIRPMEHVAPAANRGIP